MKNLISVNGSNTNQAIAEEVARQLSERYPHPTKKDTRTYKYMVMVDDAKSVLSI